MKKRLLKPEGGKKAVLKIGFYGYPPEDILFEYQQKGYEFIDLDVDFGVPDAALLPQVTCQIIKNIVNNALFFRHEIELVLATVGEDKCDSGRFIVWLLRQEGIQVRETTNQNKHKRPLIISTSNLPLRDKIDLIMNRIVRPVIIPSHQRVVRPAFGFWGVPPNDFSILDLFPDETAVYGWVRCVEAGVPGDLELELFVESGVKMVFFTQSFCAKAIFARQLAEKYQGLYIDLEKNATHSIHAKIQAFLRLA